jgi:hypothetical protein
MDSVNFGLVFLMKRNATRIAQTIGLTDGSYHGQNHEDFRKGDLA